MQKNKTTNGFGSGLNLDYNPLQTPNTVMTNALNATLLTMNGNELTLQNDMGNGRVETAYLPEGYIPLGTAELGGIIYIVSYNPLTNKSLIGSFPSPERNITSEESNNEGEENPKKVSLNEAEDFYSDSENYIISTPYKRLDIPENELNPGDKYLIYCGNFNKSVIKKESEEENSDEEGDIEGDNYISAYGETADFNPRLLPRYVRFSIVSIASNGQVIDMTDSCVWLPLLGHTGYYFMCDLNPTTIDGNTDVDDYRSLVTSNYNVFSCKSSGKLGILAQLEYINSFEITWDAIKEGDTWKFYFFTNWTYENDIEPDKINLYGLYIESEIDGKSNDDPKDIVISQYPYSIKSLLTRKVVKPDEQLEPSISDPSINPYADPIPSTGIPSINFPMRQLSDVDLVSTDIMTHQSIIEGTDEYNFQFHNPKYIDSLSYIYDKYIEEATDDESEEDPFAKYIGEYYESGEKSLRKNDGSDNQFLISTPITTNETKGILKLEISPTMPYGKLAWLKQTFNIDLSKLGTGEIDLVEYRYYILNNSITLSWGLDAYPERNKKINSVDFNFYLIDDDIIKWIYDNQYVIDHCKDVDGTWIDCETETTPDKSKYDEEGNPITDDSEGLSYWDYYYPKCEDCEECKDDYDEEGNCKYVDKIDDYKCDNCKCKYSVENDAYTKFSNNSPDYSFTVTGKSSYSGHFEESLNIYEEGEQDNVLVQNKVYLLLIDIDYSDKHIYYYRIFYTEPIFNSCYYLDEYIDYAKIDLDEKLTLSFNISDVLPNVSKDDIEKYDENNNKIEEIPSYILTEGEKLVEYSIHNNYIEDVSFEVNGTVGYNSFIVNCDFSSSTIDEDNVVTDAEAEDLNTKPIRNTNVSERSTNSINPVCKPKYKSPITINGTTITINDFDSTVICPIDIIYSKHSYANIEYELLHITCDTYNIIGDGGRGTVAIRIHKYLQKEFSSSDWSSGNNNESFSEIHLEDTGNIQSTIDKSLNSYDFVCIGGALTEGSRHKDPLGVIWGYGSVEKEETRMGKVNEGDNHVYYYSDLWFSDLADTTSSYTYHRMILFYAMRLNNDILLFTYNLPNNNDNQLNTWPNGTSTISSSHQWGGMPKHAPGFLVSSITDSNLINLDVAEAPFNNIYKPVSNANTYLINEWAIITYIHDYYERYWIDIPINDSKITLTINNNCEISENLKVNNLHYSLSDACTIRYEESRRINDDYIIDEITSGSDLNFAIYKDENGDNQLVSLSVSPTSVYLYNNGSFSVVKYLPYIAGGGLLNSGSSLEIRCTNGLINALKFTGNTINAAWIYNNQGVAIQDICLIES